MKKFLALFLTLALAAGLCLPAYASSSDKQKAYLQDIKADKSKQVRVIVTTDGECDDNNSLRHMLLYANDFDIAGLVYTSAQFHWIGDGVHTQNEINPNHIEAASGDCLEWRPVEVDPENNTGWIHDLIKNEYAEDYKLLSQHDPNYPTPEKLLSVTAIGNVLFEGDVRFETPGSKLIADAMLDDDMRPLYVQCWGGPNTVTRALMSIYETYHGTDKWESVYKKVTSKVVVQYSPQDNSWEDNKIPELFPDLVEVSSSNSPNVGYFAKDDALQPFRKYYAAAWLYPNIKTGHGKMMEHYNLIGDGTVYYGEPDNYQYGLTTVIDWGFLRAEYEKYDFLAEGDSGAWIPMIDVGLRGLESLTSGNYGTWGGRIGYTKLNGSPAYAVDGTELNYIDGVMGDVSGSKYTEEFMLDWEGRAAWTVKSFADANHPAVVKAKADNINAYAGDKVALNVSAYDVDGDALSVNWVVYEAGSKYSGTCTNLRVWDEDNLNTTFTVPQDAKPDDYFNLICEVSDGAFTRYAQIIITIPGSFRDVPKSSSVFDAVEKVKAAGIMSGVGNSYFAPDNQVIAGQVIVAMAHITGTQPQFATIWDAMLASWSDGYDAWIAELGLLSEGQTMTTVVSAEEIDTIMAKAAASAGLTYTPIDAPATRAGLAVRLASLID